MNTNKNELYIVTGAAGNLGSAIVRSLVSKNKFYYTSFHRIFPL